MVLRFVSGRIWRACSPLQKQYTQPGIITRLCQKKLENHFLKKNYSSYEGDGKTVGFVLNKKGAQSLQIAFAKTEGFVLASGAELMGSMIIFPHSIISWNVTNLEEITEESLTLFKILDPKIDIVVLGFGNKEDCTLEMRRRLTQLFRKLGLRFEALPTKQAIGLYNFLADEKRFVAAALIPPSDLRVFRDLTPSKDYLEDEEQLKALPDHSKDKLLA